MSDELFPTARQHVGKTGCKIENGICRGIQIRNVPDLGVTGEISSNPGCDADVLSCPDTLEWKDKGKTTSASKCNIVKDRDGKDNRGAVKTTPNWGGGTSGTARMRKCQRIDKAFSNEFPVISVCGIRWMLTQLKLLTDKTCIQSPNGSTTSLTCDDDLSQYSALRRNRTVTDAPYQYKNEFKLPLTYSTLGTDEALLNQFGVGDKHQYLTCNPNLWNLNLNSTNLDDINSIKNVMQNIAKIVLPHFSDLETTNVNKIDNLFTTGFWLKSYGLIDTDTSGNEINTYNGLKENGYPGGIIFIEKFIEFFEFGKNIIYYNTFLSTFLNNAKSYFLNTNYVINDEIYPSIKISIRELSNTNKINNNTEGLRLSSAFFKNICNDVLKPDLSGENLSFGRYACSCNMNPSVYVTSIPREKHIACDTTCLVHDAFPHLNIENKPEICDQIICVISDVDISIIDSSIGGDVKITNLCGTACTDGGCTCYMDSVRVAVINSDVQGGISIFQECGTCYEVQDGDYDNAREVSCESGTLVSKSSTQVTQFATWVSDNRYWLLPLFATLFAIALIGGIVIMLIPRKVTTRTTPIVRYADLPTESGYTYNDIANMSSNIVAENNATSFVPEQSTLASSLNSLGMEETAVAPPSTTIAVEGIEEISSPTGEIPTGVVTPSSNINSIPPPTPSVNLLDTTPGFTSPAIVD